MSQEPSLAGQTIFDLDALVLRALKQAHERLTDAEEFGMCTTNTRKLLQDAIDAAELQAREKAAR